MYNLLFFVAIAFVSEAISATTTDVKLLESNAFKSFKNKNYVACQKEFSELTLQFPKKGLYWFNLGSCFYMTALYQEAANAYEKSIALGVLTEPAQLYKAKSLRKMGFFQNAKDLLSSISLTPNLEHLRKKIDEELSLINDQAFEESMKIEIAAMKLLKEEKLHAALAEIRKTTTYSAGTYFFESLVLLRLNLFKLATSAFEKGRQMAVTEDEKQIQAELAELIEKYRKDRETWGVSTKFFWAQDNNIYSESGTESPNRSDKQGASLSAFFKNALGSSWFLNTTYSLDWVDVLYDHSLSVLNQSLFFPLEYSGVVAQFRLGPIAEHGIWGGKQAVFRGGARTKIGFNFDSIDFGIEGDWLYHSALNSSFSYLEGNSFVARPYLGILFSRLYAQVSFNFLNENTHDLPTDLGSLPLAHSAMGPELRLDWNILKKRLIWAQNFAYLDKKYYHEALPDLINRRDQLFTASSKFILTVSNSQTFYCFTEWALNNSNLNENASIDQNYNSFLWQVGWTWDLL